MVIHPSNWVSLMWFSAALIPANQVDGNVSPLVPSSLLLCATCKVMCFDSIGICLWVVPSPLRVTADKIVRLNLYQYIFLLTICMYDFVHKLHLCSKVFLKDNPTDRSLGLGTGNLRVGKSEPAPAPADTVPVAGTGTHRTCFSAVFLRCVRNPRYPRVRPPPAFLQPRESSTRTSMDVAARFARWNGVEEEEEVFVLSFPPTYTVCRLCQPTGSCS
jgi:hypothetical protein